MAPEDLGLLLELKHADGLVHAGGQAHRLLVYLLTFQQLGHELLARVVAVGLHSERGQRHEIDAVALLERGEVGVAQRQSQHVADAGLVARTGSHPEDVVVAPLYVPRVVLAQRVHDDVGARSAVEDVAQDVELVDGQPLYDVAECYDEVVGASCGDDGIDNDVDVGGLVVVLGALVEQLLDDVGEVLRQRLAHLRAGIFAGDVATHLDQLVDGDVVPVVDVLVGSLDELQLLLRVVDERAELLLL